MEQKMAGISGMKCSTEVQFRRGYLKYLSLGNYKNTKIHFVKLDLPILLSKQEDQSICDVFFDNIA